MAVGALHVVKREAKAEAEASPESYYYPGVYSRHNFHHYHHGFHNGHIYSGHRYLVHSE